MEDKVPSAYYKLTDPVSQIRSYVSDIIRSSVPRLGLDNVFETKDEIANSIKSHLAELMASFGYEIIVVLVINIDPNPIVKAAMNEINGMSTQPFCNFYLSFYCNI
jgi:regulator of protease activity HflC (stomatin/prohibitin superfamily)